MAVVRYLVSDVDRAVAFYTESLGFVLDAKMGAAFASVTFADLEVWLSGPASSAARKMPNGDQPIPGGWNRFVISVDDLDKTVEQLRKSGVIFRNEGVSGPGGRQIVVEDPEGNPIEIFQPR